MREVEVKHYIMKNPGAIDCHEIIDAELRTGNGPVDVVGIQHNSVIPLVFVTEIKRYAIDCDTVGQLTRYLFPLRRVDMPYCDLVGCLVGRSIKPDAKYLAEALGYRVFLYEGEMELTTREVDLDELYDDMADDDQKRLDRAVAKIRAHVLDMMYRYGRDAG